MLQHIWKRNKTVLLLQNRKGSRQHPTWSRDPFDASDLLTRSHPDLFATNRRFRLFRPLHNQRLPVCWLIDWDPRLCLVFKSRRASTHLTQTRLSLVDPSSVLSSQEILPKRHRDPDKTKEQGIILLVWREKSNSKIMGFLALVPQPRFLRST